MNRKNGFPYPDKTPPQRPMPGREDEPLSNPPGRPKDEPPTDFPDETP